jgi:universal stress protein E
MKLLEKVLLANDFSKSSENVVTSGIELAKIFHSKIVLLHVLPDDIVSEKVKTLLNDVARTKLKETAQRIEREGIEVDNTLLEFGSAHDRIVETAVAENANLILTGSGESREKEKFQLGTTTERIIEKSGKPVFVLKEGVPLNVQNILCPVDFSETSKRTLKNAIIIARRFKAELTILGVCELQGSTWFTSEKEREEENKKRCAQHEAEFEKFLEDFTLSDLNWTKEARKGKPAEEILSTIHEKMVDLLIMGTVGRTGLGRLIMGSVTEKVVREVPCSFITMKSEDVIKLQLESNISDIERHYKIAMQMIEDGLYDEAIGQLNVCLSISNMHVPAYFGLAKVYEKLNDPGKAKFYRDSGREIMDTMWYAKIEEEVRKFRGR